MDKRLITAIAIVAVVLLGLGVWALNANPQKSTDTSQQTSPSTTQSTTQTSPDTNTVATGETIVFTDNGFEKSRYTVKANQPLTVKNNSSIDVEFSSDDHPTHRDNPELNMGILKPGQEGTITPEKTGTFGIHDHEHPQYTTTVVVEN